MNEEIDRLRKAIASHRRQYPRRRFPLKLREDAVAVFEKQVSSGVTQVQAAEVLGVTAKRMRRWKEQVGRVSGRVPLVKVKVSSDPPPSSQLTLVSPTGWRLEGLTMNDLRKLVGC